MSIEVRFNKCISPKDIENDKRLSFHNLNNSTILSFDNTEIMFSPLMEQPYFISDSYRLCNREHVIDDALKLCAYMYEKYNLLSGFDGALTDAGYMTLYDYKEIMSEDEVYTVDLHNMGQEMLLLNYYLSNDARRELTHLWFNNSDKYYKLSKPTNSNIEKLETNNT